MLGFRNRLGSICVFAFAFALISIISFSNVMARSYDRIVTFGTPTIDGVISSGEWNSQGLHVFHRMFSVDSKIETYMMWDTQNLYMAAFISDWHLWDEENVNPWETYNDDSIEWHLDINFDRVDVMMDDDFLFQAEPNGNTVLGKGTGAGTVGLPSNSYFARTSYSGTLNNNTDVDNSFTIEVRIPWATLGVTPYDSMPIGTSIFRQSDDDGGDWMSDSDAIYTFYSPNEWVTSRGGESGSNRSPATWGTAVLSNLTDTEAPDKITGLTAVAEHAYSAVLYFNAPNDNSTELEGWAHNYSIRYSTDIATPEESYQDYPNAYKPKARGEEETLRILGLNANTTYYVYISAVDEHENKGPPSNIASFTTLAQPADPNDKGFVVPSPNGRYLVTLDNTPVLPMGHATPLGLQDTVFMDVDMDIDTFFQKLEDSGVTVIRFVAEDYRPDPSTGLPQVPLETSPGVYNQEALDKIKIFFSKAEQHGIYVILTPWDNYYYKDVNNGAGPYPGIISDVSTEFYSNLDLRSYQKERFEKLHETVESYTNLLMWEIVTEYDNEWWNTEAESVREAWLEEMGEYLRSLDSFHMIAPSFNIPNPHGWEGRGEFVYNNPLWSLSTLKLYYPSITAPDVYYTLSGLNPYEYASGDDKGFLPAQRTSQALKYAYGQIMTPHPILSVETGIIEAESGIVIISGESSYIPDFTQEDDERMFNAMNWAHLASGGAGTGLRYTAYTDTSLLTDKMYEYYGLYKTFCASNVDWANYNPKNITEDLTVNGVDFRYLARSAISDGKTSIIYLTKDLGMFPGPVNGSSLEIPNLIKGATYTAEFWDAGNATTRTPMSTISASTNPSGMLQISLPTWTTDIAIKVYMIESSSVNPVPDIKANGSGESVSINTGEQLTITINLSSGSYSGSNADWWLVISTPSGKFEHYDLATGNFTSGLLVTYQGALFDLGDYAVPIDTSGLATGTHTYFFGVDLNENGSVDFDQMYYDSVVVNIQ